MNEKDTGMFQIPTSSSLASKPVEVETPKSYTAIAPTPVDVAQAAAKQNISITNSANAQTFDYASLYEELSNASEEVMECRKKRLSNVF